MPPASGVEEFTASPGRVPATLVFLLLSGRTGRFSAGGRCPLLLGRILGIHQHAVLAEHVHPGMSPLFVVSQPGLRPGLPNLAPFGAVPIVSDRARNGPRRQEDAAHRGFSRGLGDRRRSVDFNLCYASALPNSPSSRRLDRSKPSSVNTIDSPCRAGRTPTPPAAAGPARPNRSASRHVRRLVDFLCVEFHLRWHVRLTSGRTASGRAFLTRSVGTRKPDDRRFQTCPRCFGSQAAPWRGNTRLAPPSCKQSAKSARVIPISRTKSQ